MCFSPICAVTGHPPQMHPFSSVMQLLFPIAGKQYPSFSPHSVQLGQLLAVNMLGDAVRDKLDVKGRK